MHITEVDQFTLKNITSYLDILSQINLFSTCQYFRKFKSVPLLSSEIGIIEDCVKHKLWNKALLFAVGANQILLVELFLHKGADCWVMAVETAAEKGHKQIANCLLQHVPQFPERVGVAERESHKHFWIRIGMCGAAKGGHLELLQYFANQITEEDERCEYDSTTSYLWAMYGAALNGHQDIIDYLENDQSTETKRTYFKHIGLYAATQGNQKDLIQMFESQGAKLSTGELLVKRDDFALGPMPTVIIAKALPAMTAMRRTPLQAAANMVRNMFGH